MTNEGLLLITSLIICIITLFWRVPTGIRIWGFELTEASSVYILSLFTFILFSTPFYYLQKEQAIKEFEDEISSADLNISEDN